MVRFEPTLENEILTDTTAAYLGCASAILNGITTENVSVGSTHHIQTNYFGYITPEEFGYILAKRNTFIKPKVIEGLDEGIPRAKFHEGRKLFEEERHRTPYLKPKFKFGRPKYSAFVFPCLCCGQNIRVPACCARVVVHCPICGSQFESWV